MYTPSNCALEAYADRNPQNAPSRFVLAYHYLVSGYPEEAAKELEVVVKLQPEDQVAQKMLDAIKPAEQLPEADTAAADEGTKQAAASDEPTTDLVGKWQAEREGSKFELTIDEDFQYSWKAIPESGQPVEIAGAMAVEGDTIILESDKQGSMVAEVKSGGNDQFQFVVSGAPADDPGLTFDRVK